MRQKCIGEWMIRGGSVILFVVLCLFYIPGMRMVRDKLPQLTEWEADGELDIWTRLPEDFQREMTICFWSDHQILNVHLDGREIYTGLKADEERFCKVSASRWNRVTIPAGSSGKELRIHSASEQAPFVKNCIYGTNDQLNRWIHQHYDLTQLIDVGIVAIGAFFVLIGLYNKKKRSGADMPLALGQSLILIGIFLRVSFKSIPIHWLNEAGCEFLSYFTYYTATIPLLDYIRKKKKLTGLYTHLCKGTMHVQLLFVTVIFVLHGLGLCDVSDFMWIGAIFIGMFILLSVAGTLLVIFRKQTVATVLPLLSSGIVFLALPMEFIRMRWLSTYITQSGAVIRISVLLITMVEIFTYAWIVQELEVQKEKMELENQRLQFQLLSSQIRPHFILNTLGAIRAMISQDAKKAEDLLWDFSMYLRNNIEEKDCMKQIPFLEELDYIETYLRLEQTRFGDRLNIKYDIQITDFWVLPLTIQPFVENAVKHGLFPMKQGGTLQIRTCGTEDQIRIEIQDDGVGFDATKLSEIMEKKTSVGLRSAVYRIETEMRGKCSIASCENRGGTLVLVLLPR